MFPPADQSREPIQRETCLLFVCPRRMAPNPFATVVAEQIQRERIMAVPLKGEDPVDTELVHGEGGKTSEEPIRFNLPLDRPHPARLGQTASYIVAGIVLSLYGVFFYLVFIEYRNKYFLVDTAVSSMPNYLQQWLPLFMTGILLEAVFAILKGGTVYTTGEALCSTLTASARIVITRVFHSVRRHPSFITDLVTNHSSRLCLPTVCTEWFGTWQAQGSTRRCSPSFCNKVASSRWYVSSSLTT